MALMSKTMLSRHQRCKTPGNSCTFIPFSYIVHPSGNTPFYAQMAIISFKKLLMSDFEGPLWGYRHMIWLCSCTRSKISLRKTSDSRKMESLPKNTCRMQPCYAKVPWHECGVQATPANVKPHFPNPYNSCHLFFRIKNLQILLFHCLFSDR